MAVLTEKENYLRLFNQEVPDWIPRLTLGPVRGLEGRVPACSGIGPSFLHEHMMRGGGKDIWGVEYITSAEAAGGLIPKTWDFLLEDIRDWRDVIKAPSLDDIDFEKIANDDIKRANVDRTQTAVSMNLHVGYFQTLMAFMGFTEGLCALYEEPEECKALFEYLNDFYCKIAEKMIDLYQPDVYDLVDDTAAWGNPFISLDMYREFFLPCYDREASFARERGIPISFHNCGKCEIFVDDMYDIGVRAWNPAQICNDLEAIQAKYGNKLALMGCWSPLSVLEPGLTDEQIYEAIKEPADKYAKNGGFAYLCTLLIPDPKDERMLHINDVINEAIIDYGHKFYNQ